MAKEARLLRVRGWVFNRKDGVEIDAEGETATLNAFAVALSTDAPPAARVDSLESSSAALCETTEFVVRPSVRST